MRAFNDQQLAKLEQGASADVARLVAEMRRLYEAEDRQTQVNGALTAMLAGTFQRLQGECRAVEAIMRMLTPAAPQSAPQEPAKRRPRVLMDEQPE